jgi:hypothetical protein
MAMASRLSLYPSRRPRMMLGATAREPGGDRSGGTVEKLALLSLYHHNRPGHEMHGEGSIAIDGALAVWLARRGGASEVEQVAVDIRGAASPRAHREDPCRRLREVGRVVDAR